VKKTISKWTSFIPHHQVMSYTYSNLTPVKSILRTQSPLSCFVAVVVVAVIVEPGKYSTSTVS